MFIGVSLLVQHGRKLRYMSQLSEPYTYTFSSTKKVLQDSLALLDRLAAPLTIDNFGQSMGYGRHDDHDEELEEGGEQKEEEEGARYRAPKGAAKGPKGRTRSGSAPLLDPAARRRGSGEKSWAAKDGSADEKDGGAEETLDNL
jgi:hypothetical protein